MKKTLLLTIGLLMLCAQMAWAQSAVRGRVLDDKGEGISGASIRVKGTNKGVNADNTGNFNITVNDGAVLIASASGFKAEEAAAVDGVTFTLARDKRSIDGVVVTALGLKREKAALGYATTTINNDELNKGNNTSALGALQGKVSGVNITSNTGGPGGSTRVVIRGEKSLSRGNNALIVVDGIPLNNSDRTSANSLESIDFGNRGNDINPDDIESVTVLKGAAATALYGSAGAAGAIMYTTKSGKKRGKGRPAEVSYSVNHTWSNILKYPTFQNSYGQGDLKGVEDDRRENFSWGLPFDGKLRPWGQIINGKQKVKPYSAIEDNVQSFFQTAKSIENNVSFSGSSEKTNYFVAFNAMNNTGIVENNFMNRYGIRLNANHEFSNKLYSTFNFNYVNNTARTDQQGQGDGGLWNQLIQTPRDIPVTELSDLNDAFNSYSLLNPATGTQNYGYYGAYTGNPYWVARSYDNRNQFDRVFGQFTTGYRFNADIELSNRIGADIISDRTYYKTPKVTLTGVDPFWSGSPKNNNGGYAEGVENVQNVFNDLILTVKKDLGRKFGFNGIFGHNISQTTSRDLNSEIDPTTNGLVVDGFYNFDNAKSPINVSNNKFMTRKMGLYTSLDFDYDKTYYLTLTARNDWSSTLFNPSYFYPSVSGSWIFTKTLGDLVNNKYLNFGKLRASWAAVGNDANAYNNNPAGFTKTTLNTGFGSNVFPFNGVPGYSLQNGFGIIGLLPENSVQSEIGVDLGLLGDRITMDFTYYENRNTNQIVAQPISAASGSTSKRVNTGVITNKGIEILMRATPIKLKNGFKWDLYATYTRNRNNVESIADSSSQILLGGFSGMSVVAAVGKPFGTFYGVDLLKDAQGRVVIDSTTGAPRSTANPQYLGNYQPKFMASFGSGFSFKGISLTVLFDTKQGGTFYSRTKDNLEFVGTSESSVPNGSRESFVWENSSYESANGTFVPNTSIKTDVYNYYTSANLKPVSQDLVDASYTKLRELSVGYTLPTKWLEKTKLGNVTLGMYGTNLMIWTPKANGFVDPEANAGGASNLQGFDYLARPTLRNLGIRLNVTF
jgi:TonB-linked SusC/RagA family outer membrane protein